MCAGLGTPDHKSYGERNSAGILLQRITQSLIHPPLLYFTHLYVLFLPIMWECLNRDCSTQTKLLVVQTSTWFAKDCFLNDSHGFSLKQPKFCSKTVKKTHLRFCSHILLKVFFPEECMSNHLASFVQLRAVHVLPCQPSTTAQAVVDMNDTRMAQMGQEFKWLFCFWKC